MKFFSSVTLLLGVTGVALGQTLPALQAKALDGSTVVLPVNAPSRPLLLMIGFSHKSSGDFDAWNKRLLSGYLNDPAVSYYELVDLQGVPSFVKPMILHGMRKEIHGTEQSHFVPFFTDEDAWKSAAGYSRPEEAYLLLADATGHVLWKTHGRPTDESVATLKANLVKQTKPH